MVPLAPTARVFCVGQNYVGHIEEMGYDIPEFPAIFMRTHASFVPHGANIIKPDASDQFDYEAELTAVIGRPTRHVSQDQALDYVAGYSIGLDMTVRGPEDRSMRKGVDGYSVLGPWLVTADEIPDPDNLDFEIRVNDEVRQKANTSDLIFDCRRLIEYASSYYTLYPGDVIMTGTPEGVGPVEPGDVMHCEIERIGAMDVVLR